jgi:hypothetical protein
MEAEQPMTGKEILEAIASTRSPVRVVRGREVVTYFMRAGLVSLHISDVRDTMGIVRQAGSAQGNGV